MAGGPSTQYLRLLAPNTILFMVFGTKELKYWCLDPLGVADTSRNDERRILDQGDESNHLSYSPRLPLAIRSPPPQEKDSMWASFQLGGCMG